MKEKELRAQVVNIARQSGYYVIYPDCMEDIGIPDILLLKNNHKPLFIELKTLQGKVSSIQAAKIRELNDKELDAYVIRSIDEFNNVIG